MNSVIPAKAGTAPAVCVCILALLAGCAYQPLSQTNLQEAQSRWAATHCSRYRLRLDIAGDRIEAGNFSVEVDGPNTRVTRNGRVLEHPDAFYSVEGLFHFLANEIELGHDPPRFFEAAPDATVYQQIIYDKTWGYPQRYVRAISGTSHNITLDIKDFSTR